jgi:hypothetical protein
LEVVFAVSMKTLSNYVNHMAETPVDKQSMPQFWGQQFQIGVGDRANHSRDEQLRDHPCPPNSAGWGESETVTGPP